ncbi:MAG TPA: hypothetical protein PKE47_06010 [Verrucomicrobiota bacterium]|nr:hypothetical protein [Verrucomicrobiota bacterium]
MLPTAYAPLLADLKARVRAAQERGLVESLPRNLRGSLPSIADIERELNRPCRAESTGQPKP